MDAFNAGMASCKKGYLMANNKVTHLPAPPLPSTRNNLLEQRAVEMRRTLNDQTEDVILELWDNPQFKAYLHATWDADAQEGSLGADNVKAAEMVRDHVRTHNPTSELATAKLAIIIKAMNVVLRRYGISRKERRNMVHGETVTVDETNNDE
jgi:hypothetical protein